MNPLLETISRNERNERNEIICGHQYELSYMIRPLK